jgi:2-C-methyl-D-erythritol 4-phosphate cytidylyltransferase
MNKKKDKIVAIVLAGGNSQRLSGYSMPKQLLQINNKHVIKYCLDIYHDLEEIDSIVLVINESFRGKFESIVKHGGYHKVQKIVAGGISRQDSVLNGILSSPSCDFVVIQNGVSILTPPDLILQCITKAKKFQAASAFVHEVYSSFTVSKNRVEKPLDRTTLGHVRDPQVFDYSLILRIHKLARGDRNGPYSNDVILLKEYGQEIHLIESPPDNFKITTDMDLKLAGLLLEKRKVQDA